MQLSNIGNPFVKIQVRVLLSPADAFLSYLSDRLPALGHLRTYVGHGGFLCKRRRSTWRRGHAAGPRGRSLLQRGQR